MALDLNALDAQDTEAPKTARKESEVAASPFPGWLKETFESGHAKVVTVRADQVTDVRSAVRVASKITGLGSRIVLQDREGNELEWVSENRDTFVGRETDQGLRKVPDNTTVRVIFKGQTRRKRRTAAEIAAARAAEAGQLDQDNPEYDEGDEDDGE